MSNQPSSIRRDRISLGNQHLSLDGKLRCQESESMRSSSALTGLRADVTAADDNAAAVTADGRFGTITVSAPGTTSAPAGAANGSVVLTNKYLDTDSAILLSCTYAGAGLPVVYSTTLAEGSCTIVIGNSHPSADLTTALDIHYRIIGVGANQSD